MPVIQVQDEFQSGDNVTASSLNDLVNDASFVSGAVDNSTLQVASAGHLKVKDNGILSNHLKSDATNDAVRAVTTNHIRNDAVTNAKIANLAVDTDQIAADAVTYAKIQNVSATDRVLGRDSAGAGNVEEITPSALRTMINVEDGATADQTDEEIKTAYENNADTNAFTDAEKNKLSGIETGATADQTDAEIKTAYENNTNTNAFTDAEKTKLSGIEANATADQSASEIKTAYESNTNTNAFTDTEKSKLSGIAAGAEVNVQSDWSATTGDAFIKNKPTIPTNNNQLTNGAGYTTNTGTVTSITAGGNLIGSEITTSGTISNLDSNNIGVIGLGIAANTADTFDSGTTYKAQIKDGLRVNNATGVAKLKLISDKSGGGGASITLKSTTPPATNEGDYSIFIGGANGKFNIRNELAVKTILMDADGDWYTLSNTQDLGKSGNRWDDVWSNGSFNGSDRNIKQDIQDLDEAEKRVAVKCKSLIKKYRMKDAVTKKGNDARIHVGIIAQELQAAFESEGLDAFRYSMIGKDTWWEATDTEGNLDVKYEATAGYNEVTQMSVRYNELLAFIISGL